MKRSVVRLAIGLVVGACAIALWLVGQTPSTAQGVSHPFLQATKVVMPLTDAKLLTPDQPLTDSLDSSTGAQRYHFSAKAGESWRVSLDVQSGNFWTSLSVTNGDFSQMLGESDGEALIDSALRVATLQDGDYNVIVQYVSPTAGTPTPGSYTIMLTKVTPKSGS